MEFGPGNRLSIKADRRSLPKRSRGSRGGCHHHNFRSKACRHLLQCIGRWEELGRRTLRKTPKAGEVHQTKGTVRCCWNRRIAEARRTRLEPGD